MDIVHHGMIGMIGFTAAEAAGDPVAGLFFLIGSVFPDLDVALMAFGKRAYLKNHQGFTHSLLLMPLFALLLVLAFVWYEPFGWHYVAAMMAGIGIHILLDYSNTYGITLLYPISKRRFSLDAIFFIDTVLLSLTVLTLAGWCPLPLYLASFAGYALMKIAMQTYVVRSLQATYAIPSALDPFDFYICVEGEEEIITYEYNVLRQKKRNQRVHPNIDKTYRELTAQSKVFNDVKAITKALHITQVDRGDDGTTIVAKDLALRNFGGKFATTTLSFDSQGKLLNEISNI